MENSFKKWNQLGAWISFGIAALTYFSTQEASGSWWDCGEFMSAAFKLQVVHEPGSPLFLLIGKVFSLLASKPSQVHVFINALSSLASAGTIFFLFLTITHFAKKQIGSIQNMNPKTAIYLILGSGFIGSLAFAFSDTFWFSAVESEVYALSSFFTALVFWAILKWEEEMDSHPFRADRWLLFIAYAMGLSIGVHLLNLLTIPALVFVFYFKKFKVDWKGILMAGGISILFLGGMLFGFIPYVIKLATYVDIYTVNRLDFPFNLGGLYFIVFLFLILFAGLGLSYYKNWAVFNKILLGIVFILLGYSSYFMVILRAQANPPLNNSHPGTVYSLYGYISREQYEDTPLLWGPDYSSKIKGVQRGEMEYRKGRYRYEETGPKLEYTYDPGETHFFPRLWSPEKALDYTSWTGIHQGKKPDIGDNFSFFWNYQINFMYWRYFMWNFAGRQNDTPSTFPNPVQGNWISGIKFLDAIRLGNQNFLPPSLRDNKAYNRLFFLPFLLGLWGIIGQIRRNTRDFTVILFLFLYTGFLLAIYLNMPPGQPRERDYAFVGSFYAFSIWIGLGLIPGFNFLASFLSTKLSLGISFCLAFISVPLWMGYQEWDDHDRSQRTVVRDFASNYLNSCAPNAILFTYGDNETYPLWYAQEVEGIRTDIRVINLNLWDADWCIDEAKNPVNQSAPLPISLDHEQYKDGVRDFISVKTDTSKKYYDLEEALKFALSDDPAKLDENGDNYLPSHRLQLKIDSSEVIRNGLLSSLEKKRMVTHLDWVLPRDHITKGQLLLLDLIQNNRWKRPIYFCSTSGEENFLGLDDFLREEGISLRLVPYKKDGNSKLQFSANTSIFYHNVMDKFRWGNIKGNIHIDDQTNSFADSFKDMFQDLAIRLSEKHEKDSCISVLNKEKAVLPESLPALGNLINESDFRTIQESKLYILNGDPKDAFPLIKHELNKVQMEIRFIQSQDKEFLPYYSSSLKEAQAIVKELEPLSQNPIFSPLSPLIQSVQNSLKN